MKVLSMKDKFLHKRNIGLAQVKRFSVGKCKLLNFMLNTRAKLVIFLMNFEKYWKYGIFDWSWPYN